MERIKKASWPSIGLLVFFPFLDGASGPLSIELDDTERGMLYIHLIWIIIVIWYERVDLTDQINEALNGKL
jgi:hypothetical protein